MRTGRLTLCAAAIGAALIAAFPAGAQAAPSAPAANGTGTLYLVQGVAGQTMDLAVDGRSVKSGAAAKTVVGPLQLKAGRHTITATPSSGTAITASVQVGSGSSVDAVVHRPADETKPPVVTAFPNDVSPVTAGSGRLTVAHTAVVGPADIRVKGKTLFANVANGEQLTLTVPAGSYPVDIVPTATSGPVVFGPADVPVTAAALTRVFAIGVAATKDMDAIVQVLPVGARGSGQSVSRVDAGDGGQAQALIVQHESGSPAGRPAWPAALLGAVLLGIVALTRGRRWRHTT